MKNEVSKRYWFNKIVNSKPHSIHYRDVPGETSEDSSSHEGVDATNLQNLRKIRAEKHLSRLQAMLEDMAPLNVNTMSNKRKM